tara:strand:- start:2148 stop:2432 length:285 start_codon:yes stop_codon:yes gene_type:complete
MTLPITVQLEAELIERTERLASKRGISVDQLVAQQLERAVAQDEYSRLQQKVAQHRNATLAAKPPQRAPRSAAKSAAKNAAKSAARNNASTRNG